MFSNVCLSEEELLRLNRALVRKLLNGAPLENKISVYLWNGERVWGRGEELKIEIKKVWALREALSEFSDLSLAESYIYDLLDLKGDIYLVFPIADWLIEKFSSLRKKLELLKLIKRIPKLEELEKCRAEVRGSSTA
jgi:cyclopropane-fatty-acyl-phospholipid synthase